MNWIEKARIWSSCTSISEDVYDLVTGRGSVILPQGHHTPGRHSCRCGSLYAPDSQHLSKHVGVLPISLRKNVYDFLCPRQLANNSKPSTPTFITFRKNENRIYFPVHYTHSTEMNNTHTKHTCNVFLCLHILQVLGRLSSGHISRLFVWFNEE